MVEHEKDAEYSHQKWPEPRKHHLPASGYLGQPSENANTEAGGGKIKVLGVDARHRGHVVSAVDPGVVLVKKEHHGTTAGEYREQPSGPDRFKHAPGALNLEDAESKQNYGKCLVLQIFGIVGETVPPTLGTEGPPLGVAEDEQERPGKWKTREPREAKKETAV